MPRLARSRDRAGHGGIRLFSGESDVTRQLPLRLDTRRQGFSIATSNVAIQPTGGGEITIQEWSWQNGPGGAGTTIETAQSYAAGACEYGEFAWLRRKGVAQPAGALTELTLPAGLAAYTSGRFSHGRTYGAAAPDLYITTRSRYLLVVEGATGEDGLSETDFGTSGSPATVGIAVFKYAGASTANLYVGCYVAPIREYNGTAWSTGASGTERGHLVVPYWQLGDGLATGGAAGDAGSAGHRLVGTVTGQEEIAHVIGDPKVAANWSADTQVGIGGAVFPITMLVADNRTVWAQTGLGTLGIDELGHTPNLLQFMEQMSSHDHFICAEYWGGLIWVGTPQGLAAFTPDGSRVDFGTFLQFGARAGTTPIYGRPRVLHGTADGLLVGYYNPQTETSYVGCLVRDNDGGWRWSMAEAVIPDEEVTYLQVVTGDDDVPRLFIGTIDAGSTNGLGVLHLYTQSLPASGDPETDYVHGGPFRAAEVWSLRLSRFGGNVPRVFRRWMLEADQLGDDYPSNTVEVGVALDGGESTTQGTATDTRWSASPRLASTRGETAQITLTVHNATTVPVIVRSVGAWYTPAPERVSVTTYPILIGERATNQDPSIVLTRLRRAHREQSPITSVDHLGRSVEWIVEDVREDTAEEAPGRGWTVHATLVVSQVRRVAQFDVDHFDVAEFG